MSPVFKRRDFLQGVTATAAGVAGFLYPGVASAKAPRTAGPQAELPPAGMTLQTLAGPDPRFAQGSVTSLTTDGSTFTMALEGAGTSRSVSMQATDVVWKGDNGDPSIIDNGDWVIMLGTPQADGSLAAQSERVFVNIVRLDGLLASATPTQITTVHPTTGAVTQVALAPNHEVIHLEDESAYLGGVSGLPEGVPIGLVGVQLADGTISATRIWA